MEIYSRETEGCIRKGGDFERNFNGNQQNQGSTLTKSIIEKKNLDVNKMMPQIHFEDGLADGRSVTFSGFGQSIISDNDKETSEAAETFLNMLPSIEDKVSQLFFLGTEAVYDSVLQKNIELMVEVRNLGGILFSEGDFLRQTYLMDCYSEVTNIPLIMCNGFSHGLAVFFKKEGREIIKEKGWYDTGRTLGQYFFNYGVLVQVCDDLFVEDFKETFLCDHDKNEFCCGVLEANILIGLKELIDKNTCCLEKSKEQNPVYPESIQNNIYEISQQKQLARDVVSSIKFCCLSEIIKEGTSCQDSIFVNFFKNRGEGILFTTEEELDFGIKSIVRLLRLGRISMLNLNRILKKILSIKAMGRLKANKSAN